MAATWEGEVEVGVVGVGGAVVVAVVGVGGVVVVAVVVDGLLAARLA